MLRMTDRSDFTAIGLSARQVPEAMPPGRAWSSAGPSQLQVALLAADPSGQAQVDALRGIAAAATARDAAVPPGRRPFPIRSLPATVSFADAHAALGPQQRRPMWGLLGLGGDDLAPVGVDFAGRGQCFLVAGPSGSGRSNVLASLGVSLLAAGTRLVVLTPRESPLRRLAAHPLATLLDGPEPDPAPAADQLAAGGPLVFLVDDADVLPYGYPADAMLREVATGGRDRGIGLALAGGPDGLGMGAAGWIGEAKRSRQGILLAPQRVLEGDLVGARIPGSLLRSQVRPGRATWSTRRGLGAIVVPHTVLR